MNFDICRESLKSSQYSPICVPSTAGVYVIGRVGDGGTMGEGRSIGDCMTAIKAASNESVCIGAGSGFAPARATDGAVLGDSVAVATCTAATKLGREGIICTQSEGPYFVTNISKKQRLGEMADNTTRLTVSRRSNHRASMSPVLRVLMVMHRCELLTAHF